jgi:hypothetical protein
MAVKPILRMGDPRLRTLGFIEELQAAGMF